VHGRVLDVVRGLVADDVVVGVHDVADGGIALCVAEMAVASECGVVVSSTGSGADFFNETPSRIVVAVADGDVAAVVERCRASNVPVEWIGAGGGDRILIGELVDVALAAARSRWASRLPSAFGTAVTH
jgi:phosphoribosylformylglycinamidine synthase